MIEELKRQWRSGSMVIRLILINLFVFLALLGVYLILLLVMGNGLFADAARDHYVMQWLKGTPDVHLLITRPWTMVTYMFTHTGLMHLFWNMVMLYFGGRLFEDLLGGRRLLGYYVLGGLAGFVLYVLLTNLFPQLNGGPQGATVLGASAAVISVFVGIAAYRPHMLVNIILIGPVKLMYVAAFFLLLDLVGIGSGDGVAHEAHIGGIVFGYLASQQLKRGSDWSLGFVNALDRFFSLFKMKRGPRLRVEKPYTRSARSNDADYNKNKKDQQARIDAILDKISRSGYDSLSKEEKDFLFKSGK
ncbi:MAG TPA: rhomboid family intramembrane serine protease [Flavobacteriales bacterium]|nr:rhomboid family intramembrane serine protease [Flavobacteriales bacterium]